MGILNAIGVAPPVGQPEVSMEAAPPHPVDRPWLPSGALVVPSSSQQISDRLVCQEPADTEQRSSRHPFLNSTEPRSRVTRRIRVLRPHRDYPLRARVPPPRRSSSAPAASFYRSCPDDHAYRSIDHGHDRPGTPRGSLDRWIVLTCCRETLL